MRELVAPPELPVDLGCVPAIANQHARLVLRNHTRRYVRNGKEPSRWHFRAEAGHYKGRATFPKGSFKPGQCDVWVDTPEGAAANIEVSS